MSAEIRTAVRVLSEPASPRLSMRPRPGTVAVVTFVAFALVPVVAGYLGEPFYVRMCTRIMILALAALSLDLILGYGGMVSFGHAAFVGLGAYAVGILSFHADSDGQALAFPLGLLATRSALVAWPAAMLASAVAALVIGLVALRTSGLYFLMITLAFAQMIYFFAVSSEAYGGMDGLQLSGASTLPYLDIGSRTTFFYVVLTILVAAYVMFSRLVSSRFGMVIRGAKDNERRLECLGFDTFPYRLASFVLAGAVAGLAGALLANNEQFVSPTDMTWSKSGEFMAMIVLGGTATLIGPILGTIAYVALEYFLGNLTTHWQMLFGPALILAVMFGRRGLVGLLCGERAGT